MLSETMVASLVNRRSTKSLITLFSNTISRSHMGNLSNMWVIGRISFVCGRSSFGVCVFMFVCKGLRLRAAGRCVYACYAKGVCCMRTLHLYAKLACFSVRGFVANSLPKCWFIFVSIKNGHYAQVLFLGKIMPKFSFSCKYPFALCRTGNHGPQDSPCSTLQFEAQTEFPHLSAKMNFPLYVDYHTIVEKVISQLSTKTVLDQFHSRKGSLCYCSWHRKSDH
jgi:hypothetical protein